MMNPLTAVGSAYANIASFGRAPRSEYWWFTLWSGISLILAVLLDVARGPDAADMVTLTDVVTVFAATVTVMFVNFFAMLSLSIRRLHDIGFSGWWYLLVFVPFGSFILMILACLPSEKRPNNWGPQYGVERLPGASIFAETPVEDVPEIYRRGGMYGEHPKAPALSPAELQAARKAEVAEYYKNTVMKRAS